MSDKAPQGVGRLCAAMDAVAVVSHLLISKLVETLRGTRLSSSSRIILASRKGNAEIAPMAKNRAKYFADNAIPVMRCRGITRV